MIVIHHNPDCGTSRNALASIRATGAEPVVIEYLKTGWTRGQLLGLFAAADITPREALRTSKSPAESLGLTDPAVTDDALLDAMVADPILANRPLVCTPKGVALCRPTVNVVTLLPAPPTGPVHDAKGAQIWPAP
ncbi:arsenate reductase (glutaredoxin) [Rhodobacteraceae bacterium N5(2021)]|uniref:Arsenate reductase n=1 Tax=Gymnodinialimonas phycosphaerae TaxID=2841589 RepID=A0A975TXG5_9RHOB|nr:arsenate reductase (glutaredoxin) [Gymnodinialimonas phycosphaerae]MBY4892244.1 arsenate reductase (glutaredoxin) [Gymnodinialimonas phycosphaerae]